MAEDNWPQQSLAPQTSALNSNGHNEDDERPSPAVMSAEASAAAPVMNQLANHLSPLTLMSVRDSFDRFGDDLCQHVLSYLPIKDKTDLLLVSKQWLRSLVLSQNTLTIVVAANGVNETTATAVNVPTSDYEYNEFVVNTDDKKANTSEKLLQTLVPIVRRFTEIKRLVINGPAVVITGEVLRVISTYCPLLRSLVVNNAVIYKVVDQDIDFFADNLGPNLNELKIELRKPIDSQTETLMFELLSSVPNIQTLHMPLSFESVEELIDLLYELKVQNICLNDMFKSDEDFEHFVDVFGDRLRRIEWKMSPDLSVYESLHQLSRFKALKELSLNIRFEDQLNDPLNREFEELAANCPQLSRLRLEIVIPRSADEVICKSLITGQWFELLGKFSSLKWLRFALIIEGKREQKNYLNQFVGTVNQLSRCLQLKHLYFVVKHINDQTFDDISVHLPQLRSLRLVCNYCVITGLTFKSLSTLPCLRHLSIVDDSSREWRSIDDKAICHLMDNSRRIGSVELKCFTTIGLKSVKAIIRRALRQPQKQLYFAFNDTSNVLDGLEGHDISVPINLDLKKTVIPEVSLAMSRPAIPFISDVLKTFLMRS